VKRFRGGLAFKAHRLLYHSTLGWRVIQKKKKKHLRAPGVSRASAGRQLNGEVIDYKTSMITDENPLRGLLFYWISVSLTHYTFLTGLSPKKLSAVAPLQLRSPNRCRTPWLARFRRETPPALEATQGQMDGFFSSIPYACHLEAVASVGD